MYVALLYKARHAPAQAFRLTYGYHHSATAGVLQDPWTSVQPADALTPRQPTSGRLLTKSSGFHPRLESFWYGGTRERCQALFGLVLLLRF